MPVSSILRPVALSAVLPALNDGVGLPPHVIADAARMAAIRALRASVLGGTRKKFVILGDSTSAGYGAGTGGGDNKTGARVLAPGAEMARDLAAAGVPSRSDGWFGSANFTTVTTAGYTLYNPDVVFGGAGWAPANATSLGAYEWQNSTTTEALTFTPQKAADRFDIYYQGSTGFATFTVTDGSGTLATINAASPTTNNVRRASVTRASASADPISIQRNGTGANLRILGIDPWNSTLAEMCVLNLGAVGWTTNNYTVTTNVFEPANALPVLVADFTHIELGLNDYVTSVAKSTYLSRLQTIITAQLLTGGVVLGVPNPSLTSNYLLPSDWLDDIKALAVTNGIPALDNYSLIGTADGSLYSEGPHLSASGYAMKGSLLAAFALA